MRKKNILIKPKIHWRLWSVRCHDNRYINYHWGGISLQDLPELPILQMSYIYFGVHPQTTLIPGSKSSSSSSSSLGPPPPKATTNAASPKLCLWFVLRWEVGTQWGVMPKFAAAPATQFLLPCNCRCKTQKVVVRPFLLNGEGDDGVKTLPFYTIR
jgi:hypothetical protein